MPLEPHNPRRVLSPPFYYYSIKSETENRRIGEKANNFKFVDSFFLRFSGSPILSLFALHGPLNISFCLPLLNGLSFLVFPFAFSQSYFHLCERSLKVDFEGY